MKIQKIFIFTLIYFNVTMSFNKSQAQIPDTATSYTLVFHDEFNDSINMDLWKSKAHYDNALYTYTNDDDSIYALKYFTEDFSNFEYTDSTIKLVVKKEPDPGYWGEGKTKWNTTESAYFDYTLARLFSRKQFRYGYFEIRVKIPDPPSDPASHKSLATGFWMYEEDGNSNIHNCEIDCYEINCRENTWVSNVHFAYDGRDEQTDPYTYPNNLVFNDSFKTFSFDWSADSIIFYLDGIRISSSVNHVDSLIAMPIYIDMGVGYNQFGDSINSSVYSQLPFKVEVDYVRVYQRKLDSLSLITDKTYCSSVNNHDFKLYKSVTIGGSSCNDVVTNKNSFPVEAIDFVLLNEGFEATSGSNFYIKTMKSLAGQNYSQELHDGKLNVIPPKSWWDRMLYFY